MRVYEIFVPEVGTYVKFKVLTPETVETFLAEATDLPREDYMKKVLENVIFNMRSEIVDSLKMMSHETGVSTIEALFNGCVMLNPGIDIDTWVRIAYSGSPDPAINVFTDIPGVEVEFSPSVKKEGTPIKKISKAKFLNLQKYLKERVIGQDQAIEAVVSALKRSQAGLNDEQRPLGVFLFAGSSGVGKTHLAKELHKYLFGDEHDIVRVDCGEYQQKHDSQKLIGSPPGYVGHDDGGQLTNQLEQHPQTVILLDEVEKAHPDLWNTFLRIFDDGILTNNKGDHISFRNAIIIMTTNLGNDKVVEALTGKGVGFGARSEVLMNTMTQLPREQVERLANEAIKKEFRPEFLNRIDKVIVFNHLSRDDFAQIAELELQAVDNKLSKKRISFQFDESAINALIEHGVDTVRGARGMAQIRRDKIENLLADILLNSKCPPGTIFELSYPLDKFIINIREPIKAAKVKTT